MTSLNALVRRNIKLFFKDKGMFFTSLITPLILLVLYATFLADVYKDTFINAIPDGFMVSEKLLNGTVGAQLLSSLLAVCCVTVAVCSNMLMVQDKANGTIRDLDITPVNGYTLALSYYISSVISTLIVCYFTVFVSFVYLAFVGWYLSFVDVLLLLIDVLLLVLFGTAFSSVINFFMSSQGQISAVGTIVSSGYGFICGAYMPISQYAKGLRVVISFLPGTYGTALLRNHAMRGVFSEMEKEGLPLELIDGFKNSVDYNLYFFEKKVTVLAMYAAVILAIAILVGIYILMNYLREKSKKSD